ncbi:hypothetical protein AAFF_G00316610 [Aldrovandia affinis]|uniref:Uncharacterized protein n=1 Tax=Aldrovandia affinis TaxID=143900 RepID=A0AAD7SQ23_9TELE|nr:hypothetical protein AAFF_G00316610 [Aldrovandia affinis]
MYGRCRNSNGYFTHSYFRGDPHLLNTTGGAGVRQPAVQDPVEERIEKNPDLKAIRIASVNPILDPWIYILLRKAVVLKLVEKIKCLFCKIGGRAQQRSGNFRYVDEQFSSAVSHESPYITPWELREVTSSSQTFLYLPEKKEGHTDSCHLGQMGSGNSVGHSSFKGLGESDSLNEHDADYRTSVGPRVGVMLTNLNGSLSFPKDQSHHVTFTDKALNLQEKCI